MYGIINHVVQLLVEEKFGIDFWNKIKAAVGNVPEKFIMKEYYDDEITYDLVRAIMKETGLGIHEVLFVFGNFWVDWTLRSSYIVMMRVIGPDLYTFLGNLNALHVHLSMTFTNMTPPEFRCEKTDDPKVYRLHYHSNRKSLNGIAAGIVEQAGKVLFNLKLDIKLIYDGIEEERETYRNYYIYEIREIGYYDEDLEHVNAFKEEDVQSHMTDDGLDIREEYISRSTFCTTFPFHIIFDEDLQIKRTGYSLSRKVPILRQIEKPPMDELFESINPPIKITTQNLLQYLHTDFTLQLKATKTADKIQLKGQMVKLPNERLHFLFIGSPVVSQLSDLKDRGLFISDFPLHDPSRELMLLNEQRVAEFQVHKQLEETTAVLEKTSAALAEEKIKTDNLLHSMLPPTVAERLREGHHVDAGEYEMVSVLFSDIVGFTHICSRCKPMDVVEFLNNLYTRFDKLTGNFSVYKVETIGDAYMVVSGVPEVTDHHAQNAIDMGLAMIEKSEFVYSPADGKQIQIRIGIHSGPVVAGVVGHKMPRYCLFGDTVNTASRMESHGVPGTVHISSATYELVKTVNFNFQFRGDIAIKGKGIMKTYFVLSGKQVEVKEVETVVNDTSNGHRGQIRSQQWMIVESSEKDDVNPALVNEFTASSQRDAAIQTSNYSVKSSALATNSHTNGDNNTIKPVTNGNSKVVDIDTKYSKDKTTSSFCTIL